MIDTPNYTEDGELQEYPEAEDNRSVLQRVCEKADMECFSYSGRSMYGRNCLALRIEDNKSLFTLALELAYEASCDDLLLELQEEISLVETDSLGLDTVVYFPNIEYHIGYLAE